LAERGSSMMKYRAIAVGLRIEGHPVGIVGQVLDPIVAWAEEIVKKHEVEVKIYETSERVLLTKRPEPKPSAPCNYSHDTLRDVSAVTNCPGCQQLLRARGEINQ
jgi:hypothetical protein